MRLSIIINNFNYGRFISSAIDSALAVDWPDKEVIVVDDGSTDDSRDIITRYADRIIPVLKENGGQCDAVNTGFACATGEAVIILDSDDLLFPDVGRKLFAAWRPGLSCVQFGQHHVGDDGERLGSSWPNYTRRHTPDWLRETYRRTAFYDSPPTSGNAWATAFLVEVFPLPVVYFLDDYLHNLAPFFGDVLCLPDYYGGEYRIHSSNISSYAKNFSAELAAKSCEQESDRVNKANALLLKLNKIQPGGQIDLELYWDHMHHRLMYRRFLPRRYPYGDGLTTVFRKFARSVLHGDLSIRRKLLLLAWGIAAAFAPRRAAFWLCRMREEHRLKSILRSLRSFFGR